MASSSVMVLPSQVMVTPFVFRVTIRSTVISFGMRRNSILAVVPMQLFDVRRIFFPGNLQHDLVGAFIVRLHFFRAFRIHAALHNLADIVLQRAHPPASNSRRHYPRPVPGDIPLAKTFAITALTLLQLDFGLIGGFRPGGDLRPDSRSPSWRLCSHPSASRPSPLDGSASA